MQIERIEIGNYRAFHHAVLNDLPPMPAVVGANGSDKSTFFDVFSFLKDTLNQNVATVTTYRLSAQSASNFRASSQGLVLFFQLGFQDRSMSEFITTLTLENAIASPTNGELFGDGTTGSATTATEWSDVDLLVILPNVSDKRHTAIEIRRALGDLPVCKDIVVATPEEVARRGHLVGTALRSALREGKVLYERS